MSRRGVRSSAKNKVPIPETGRKTADDIADSIQSAVSGAISSALAPVLQSLQAQSTSTGAQNSSRGRSLDLDNVSDDDDFQAEPAAKKR